jgi:hypothetical protein
MPKYNAKLFGREFTLAETDDPISKSLGRRLSGQPDTLVDSGGSVNSYNFDGQEIRRDDLLEIKKIRESGGVISQLVRLKALLYFGGGVRWEVPENEETTQMIDGEEITLKDWLNETFANLSITAFEIGEDALWYPYGVGETVENRAGNFSHIAGVEPWTMMPETNRRGDIVKWKQITQGDKPGKPFDPDDIVHFPINKSSARDKTGISEVLRNKEEIEQFRQNQLAIKNAIEMHSFPQRHVKVGREGSAPIRDNELRRVRNLFDSRQTDSDTVYVTGQDVEIDALEAENFEFQKVTENDLKQLALAFGLPVEAANVGSDGLGSGKPAELRMTLLKLDIQMTRRLYTNTWVRDVITPVVRDYSPFDHTRDFDMEMIETVEGMDDMAEIINKVGDWMETNEAREMLNLEPKDELEGEYGKPEDAQPDDAGGLFNEAVDKATENRELSDVRILEEIPDKYTEDTGLSESDFVPNQDVLDVVDDAREFIDKHGLPNPEDQQEGAARVNQLYDAIQNNKPIDPDFWEEIKNFHSRHRAQDNHVCDESSLPEESEEIDRSKFEPCMFDNGYFSDQTWGSDAAYEQSKRITEAIEDTEGVELSGDTDFRHPEIAHTEHLPKWDKELLRVHAGIWDDDTQRELTSFSHSQMPDFVQSRIRETIMSGAIFSEFDTIPSNELMNLREQLTESLVDSESWTIDGVTDQLLNVQGIDDRAKAETIARTETASIVNSAREEGYQEQGQEDSLFYWTGAKDDRVTAACEWLINQTNPFEGGDPVPMDELKELIDEAPTHDPEMQDNLARPEDFVVHPNERKTFARAPPSEFGTAE